MDDGNLGAMGGCGTVDAASSPAQVCQMGLSSIFKSIMISLIL